MGSLTNGLIGAALLTVAIGGTAAAQYPPSYADDMACRQYAQQAIVRPIQEGRAKAGKSADLADFDNAPYVRVSMGDDLAKCRDALRPGLAFYIGGMGAREANFYNDLAKRIGYEPAAAEIQNLFLAGKRAEAAAAVPDALIDEISLIGPPERIRDRLQAWRDIAGKGWVGSLVLVGADAAAMRVIAEAVL